MHEIPPDTLDLIERKAPEFITAVQRAQATGATKEQSATIFLTLDVFAEDPFLLYACLWYSATCGVTCTFAPTGIPSDEGGSFSATKSK
jgi:hypothetical protein